MTICETTPPPAPGPKERLVIAVRRVPGVPVVAVRVCLRGGTRSEEIPGQACITGRMLDEGSRRRDWRQIAEDAEGLGMILSSSGSREAHGVHLDALTKDWEQALEWAAELTFEASFPEDRCDWLRRQAAAELESLADRPEVRTGWGFLKQLYTPHPNSRPRQGDAASLRQIESHHCVTFHRQALRAGGVVSVTGDIDEGQVQARLEKLFGDLTGPAEDVAPPPMPQGLAPVRQTVSTSARDQAHLFIGHLTVPRHHPDLVALELASVVLGAGSGLTGRIPARIREREGLAYTAHATLVSSVGLDSGHLETYIGTAAETVEQARRGVEEELTRLVEEGIKPQELEDARAYLLGREPFRRETARQWADLLVEARFYGLPLDRPEWREAQLRALDLAAVEEAVRRHVSPSRLRVTVGLPED